MPAVTATTPAVASPGFYRAQLLAFSTTKSLGMLAIFTIFGIPLSTDGTCAPYVANTHLSDIAVKCNDTVIHAHKVVLSVKGSWLPEGQQLSDVDSITLENVPPEVARAVVRDIGPALVLLIVLSRFVGSIHSS